PGQGDVEDLGMPRQVRLDLQAVDEQGDDEIGEDDPGEGGGIVAGVEGVDQDAKPLTEPAVAEVGPARPAPGGGQQRPSVEPGPADPDPAQPGSHRVDEPDPPGPSDVFPDRLARRMVRALYQPPCLSLRMSEDVLRPGHVARSIRHVAPSWSSTPSAS